MNDALEALPENWAIRRDRDGWSVGEVDHDSECGGDSFGYLAGAETISGAIAAAYAEVEKRDREERERTEDYARRKAAGELTQFEIMQERTASIWSAEVMRQIEIQTVFTQMVGKTLELKA